MAHDALAHDRFSTQAPDRPRLLRLFAHDADELLTELEVALLTWRARPADPQVTQRVLRCTSSVKRTATDLELEGLADLSSALTSLVTAVAGGLLAPTPGLVAMLLHTVDYLRQLLPYPTEIVPEAGVREEPSTPTRWPRARAAAPGGRYQPAAAAGPHGSW